MPRQKQQTCCPTFNMLIFSLSLLVTKLDVCAFFRYNQNNFPPVKNRNKCVGTTLDLQSVLQRGNINKLQHERSSCDYSWATRQEIPSNQALQHRALSTALLRHIRKPIQQCFKLLGYIQILSVCIADTSKNALKNIKIQFLFKLKTQIRNQTILVTAV